MVPFRFCDDRLSERMRRSRGGVVAGWRPRYPARRETLKQAEQMTGRIEARLKDLKIELPQPGTPLANYVPFVRSGDLLFVAGQVCQWNGERRFIGKLGREISFEQGQEAARLCALNILAVARSALSGDLDRVVRCVRLGGFVNSIDDFTQQPQIVNGASDLIVQVFGDAGRHARTAVGVNVLPGNVAVEVDAVFEVR
jgi:enamine deaminase RidA (YjgF/YER057c/UK114 family)